MADTITGRIRAVLDELEAEAVERDDSNWLLAAGEAAGLRMAVTRIREVVLGADHRCDLPDPVGLPTSTRRRCVCGRIWTLDTPEIGPMPPGGAWFPTTPDEETR